MNRPHGSGLTADQAAQALLEDVSRRLEPELFDESRGLWWIDCVRLRSEAVKE